MSELHVVTGAFGFTGRYVTKRLLAADIAVRTITGNPQRANPFGPRLSVAPFNFDEPGKLIESLRGATTLYNTYWVRFPYGRTTYEGAVRNTLTMIRAAEAAGVRRMVHVSITNPSEDSPFRYFSGKAEIERAIRESSLSHAIIRPAVLFGSEDVLINNIAWLGSRCSSCPAPASTGCSRSSWRIWRISW